MGPDAGNWPGYGPRATVPFESIN